MMKNLLSPFEGAQPVMHAAPQSHPWYRQPGYRPTNFMLDAAAKFIGQPIYDAWYNAALTAANDSIRYTYYRKMDSMIVAEAPVVPLFYDEVVRFTNTNISGLGINAMNLLDLRKAKKKLN